MTATVAQLDAARTFGLHNVDLIATAALKAKLPFHVACALMQMESGGRNVYGHDANGALSGFPGEVNDGNFEVFLWMLAQGVPSNGVGPCQITWKGFFPDMAKQGLNPADPADNMLYGFRLLAKHYKAHKTWELAGKAYNGKLTYGRTFARRVAEWAKRLKAAV